MNKEFANMKEPKPFKVADMKKDPHLEQRCKNGTGLITSYDGRSILFGAYCPTASLTIVGWCFNEDTQRWVDWAGSEAHLLVVPLTKTLYCRSYVTVRISGPVYGIVASEDRWAGTLAEGAASERGRKWVGKVFDIEVNAV